MYQVELLLTTINYLHCLGLEKRKFSTKPIHLKNLPFSSQPFVSAMHCGYWGSWVFSGKIIFNQHFLPYASLVSNVQASTNNTIEVDFERGGFQEARGCSQGALWFIENAFEFLDSPNEWLYDEKAQTLYYVNSIPFF